VHCLRNDEERALPLARLGGNPKYLKYKGVGYRQRGLFNLAVPLKVPEVQGNGGISKAAGLAASVHGRSEAQGEGQGLQGEGR
jgi:hypothetical protein